MIRLVPHRRYVGLFHLGGLLEKWIRGRTIYNDVESRIGGPVPHRITTSFCPVMVSQIKAVSCHAPYLGSSNWKTLSVKALKILPTEIPTVHGIFGGEGYTGEATELRCNISSKSPVKVQWYAGDKIVQESIEPTGSCLVGNCKMVVSTLKIRSADNTNSSYYTCTATNFKGTDSKTAFHVPREIVRPFIIGHDEMLEFYVGDVNRTLSCTVSGEPRPNRIYWLKFISSILLEELFNDSNSHTNSSTSIYTIPEIGLNSAGLYRCIASNRLQDQALKKIYVNVSKSPVTRNIIISSVAFIVLIGIIFGVLLRKYRRENKDLIKFEKQFRLGIQQDSNSKVEDGQIRPLSLPYIEDFEIDRREWKKEQCIGGGEFGEVWWGTLRRFQSMQVIERVAIKFLNPDGQQIQLLKVLCSELKMMMRIKQLGSDPNIVNFIGATTKNFQKMEVSLIMELCSLGSLKSYIVTNRSNLLMTLDIDTIIVLPEVAKWSSEIASGMLFLSMHQIVHIDLAARNIFLTADKVAKVGDYGLSRSLYDKGFYKQKQSPFRPELWTALEGLREDIFSVQSDVWSYGVTIWELFSMGSDPAYSQVDTIAALENGERLEKPPLATEETYQLLRSCWEAVPDSRPDFSTLLNYFNTLQAELDVRVDEMKIIEGTTPNPDVETNAEFTEMDNQTTNFVAEKNTGFTERYLNPFKPNVPVVPLVSMSKPEVPGLETTSYLKFEEAEGFSKIAHEPYAELTEIDNRPTNPVAEPNTRFTERKFNQNEIPVSSVPTRHNPNKVPALEATRYLKFDETEEGFSRTAYEPCAEFTEMDHQTTNPVPEPNTGFTERKINPYQSNFPVLPVPLSSSEIPALEATRYLKFEEADLPKVEQTSEITILISKF